MDLSNINLVTERLRLASIRREDTQTLFREFTPEIAQYMLPAPAKNLEEKQVFVQRNIDRSQEGKELVCGIYDKETGELFGRGGIWNIDTKTPELGIWIKKNAHGNHFATEACLKFKQWAEENLTYDYLKYPVDKRNIPSRKIAESLGGVIEDEYPGKNAAGENLDIIEYRIYKG